MYSKFKGGLLTGKRVEATEVEALAKLPSRDQLLSMLLNSMLGPIRKLAYATVAIADKKWSWNYSWIILVKFKIQK